MLPVGHAQERTHAVPRQTSLKRAAAIHRRRHLPRHGARIERDQVHADVEAFAESRQRVGVGIGVVDTRDQRPLQQDRAGRTGDALAQLRQAPFSRYRQQSAALLRVDGMQRNSHLRLGPREQLVHPRDDPHRAHRDAPLRHGEPARLAEDGNRPQDLLQIVQRLPHPHEDDVRRSRSEMPGGERILGDDLRGAQIAHEPEAACFTEDAAASASDL